MKNNTKFSPLFFMIPALVLTVIFIYYPLIMNFIYSFYDFSAISPEKKYVGVKNFIDIIHDDAFYISLKNNIKYAFISLVFQVFFSFILASILEEKAFKKHSNFLRTLYFLPALLSVTIIALIFQFFYNPMNGLFNNILSYIGLSNYQQDWLGNSNTSIYAVILTSQWQSIGYTTLLFIVTIQNISRELYEAASIDGANKFKQFIHITLPQSKKIILVVSIVTVAQAFTVFGEPYILTGGGPGYSSSVLATYLYESAFSQDRMGYASAIAVVVFFITVVILGLQIKLSSKKN